jgi:hypothetical protein
VSLNYVTLVITEQDAGQDAGTGTVSVAPTSAVTASGVTVVSETPVARQFSAGTVSIQLVATDNAGTSPAAGFWAYEVTLPGVSNPVLILLDFANGASQRLDNLSAVVAKTTYGPAATGGVTSFASRTGAVVPQSGDYTAAETGAVAKAGDTMGGHLAPAVVALTDAATVAIDASAGNDFRLLTTSGIGATRAIGAPSNLVDGQAFTITITQDSTGGRAATWNAVYKFGAAGTPTLTATANASDVLAFKNFGGAVRYLGSALGF